MGVSAAQDEKKKALNLAIAQIEKSYGKGAIMKMGPDAPKVRVEFIPTGAINLDAAIGVGGIPRGWDGGFHRRGACAGHGLCDEAWRGRREAAGFAAGHG